MAGLRSGRPEVGARARGVWIAALAAGAVAAGAAPARAQASAYEQLQSFSNLLNQIRLNYVDTVAMERLVRGAIVGMLRSLDPHSYYLQRDDAARLDAWREGRGAGTGIVLEDEDGVATVQTVLALSPAARAGVMPGDRLVAVNDSTAAGRNAQTLQARLVGERGSRVKLVLERGARLEPESLAVTLRNEILQPQAVRASYALAPGLAYVQLQEFTLEAGRDLQRALGRALSGGGPRRIILDLRGNPGGSVQSAVDVAAEFLPARALVFRTHGRRHDADQEYRTTRDGAYRDAALIVLIDGRSASASEAVAGSLQDHDRALIVGRRSFGKALMQQEFLLQPSGDVVWLTVGHILTPSGRVIQRPYRDESVEQYREEAGKPGPARDTATYKTDAGRVVRGGGGIEPDTAFAGPAPFPAWWSVAADSSFDHAVADSVAGTLAPGAAARAAWLAQTASWPDRLVRPFLERVRARLHVAARPDSALAERLARTLAARVAEVRWGPEAGDELRVRHDPDIRAALAAFPAIPGRLAPARR